MMPYGGQTIKKPYQPQILLHITAIFIENAKRKKRPFMPFIGGHGKLDIGLGMVGCGILALIF